MDFSIDCDGPMRSKVEDALNSAFSPVVCETNGDRIEKCITDVLFGTKKIRLNNYDDTQRSFMEGLVSRYVALGEPINMVGMWGAVKAYGFNHNRSNMDIWDAMAVSRLENVAADVKKLYSPGLKTTIICEDITESIIGQCGDALPQLIKNYSEVVGKYAASLSGDVVFTTESELLKTIGKTPNEFLQLGENLTAILAEYWKVSSQLPESEWESSKEYKALNEIGWRGLIPPAMREHYINRVGSEYPQSDTDFRIKIACRYLGNSLARYRIGMVKSKVEDATGLLPTIKMGFGTHAPGVVKSMQMGRVDYKVKASKNSKTTTPPWCGWGVLEDRGGTLEPTILGVRFAEFDTEPVQVTSNGVCFQADILKIAA